MNRLVSGVLIGAALAAFALSLPSCSGRAKPRVLFVGVDGATWDVMSPMMASGDLPNFRKLADRGVVSPLATFQPSLSPIVWTSIATAKTPDKHGILGFVRKDASGKLTPVLSNERKARAVWDILCENGVRCGVVGWWLTWPAEPVDGFMVSSLSLIEAGLWKGSVYSGLPGQIHPAAWSADLDALVAREQTHGPDVARELFGDLPADFGNETQKRVIHDTVAAQLSDRLFYAATREFWPRAKTDFTAVYFGAVDVASHRFWKYYRPHDLPGRAQPEDVSMLRNVIPNAYRWVDARLGELVDAAGPEAIVIVASDHGFHAETRPDMSDDERSGGHEDSSSNLPGIFVVAGPGIRHEDWRKTPPAPMPSVYDVMPTVLEVYGLGAAHDMDGEPCASLFTTSYREAHPPPERPTTYEIRPRASESTPSPDSAAVDRAKAAAVERLRALGYLGSAAPAKPEPLEGVRADYDLHDITIENAIASITLQAGAPVEIDDDAKLACAERRVDLALHQVTARAALEAILGTTSDLTYTVGAEGVAHVHVRKPN